MENISTTKSISGDIDNHENLKCEEKNRAIYAPKFSLCSSNTAQNCLANSKRSQLSVNGLCVYTVYHLTIKF